MPRSRYLVCYDISEAKRLRKVAKTVEGYGTRLQFSVFECLLDNLRLEHLKADLREIINNDEDQIIFVPLGQGREDNFIIEHIGIPYLGKTKVIIV